MKLRAGEISFWQLVYAKSMGRIGRNSSAATEADTAVMDLRARLENQPSPDHGRKFELDDHFDLC